MRNPKTITSEKVETVKCVSEHLVLLLETGDLVYLFTMSLELVPEHYTAQLMGQTKGRETIN